MLWFKEILPLVLQLLGELFRTDGDQKIGFGLKITILFNIMLIVVSGYLGTSYFELYHKTLEAKVEVVRLLESEKGLNAKVLGLELELAEHKKTNSGKIDPSDSYKQCLKLPVYKLPVPEEPEYDLDNIRNLLDAINGK